MDLFFDGVYDNLSYTYGPAGIRSYGFYDIVCRAAFFKKILLQGSSSCGHGFQSLVVFRGGRGFRHIGLDRFFRQQTGYFLMDTS